MNGLPPMLRRRDALKFLGGNIARSEFESFEDCGLIKPFQKIKRGKSKMRGAGKWYRTNELQKIRDGEGK